MPVSDWVDYSGAPGRWVTLQRLAIQVEGGSYEPTGDEVRAYGGKLSASQTFGFGQEQVRPTLWFYADLPLSISEHDRLSHPVYGELDIVESIEIPEEGMVRLYAVDVRQGAGQ